jgi:tetratricopeptide (TPR) repeat protein
MVLVLAGLGTCVMAYFRSAADPASRAVDAASRAGAAPRLDLEDEAERFFLRGDYEPAARAYRQIIAQDPNHSLAWVRLAYATHEQGDFEAAVPLHERAAEFSENRISSLFKLGCALARLGRTEEAIHAIEQAVEVGYRDRVRAEQEEDLASIRGESRFETVLNRMAPPAPGQAPLDFLVGHWVIREPETGELSGFLSVQRLENSHLYQEQWNSFQGKMGRGMAFLDPVVGNYEFIRVDDQGEIHRLRGTFEDGVLRFEGERVAHTGLVTRLLVTFEPTRNARIIRTFLESEDEGESWLPLSEHILHREEPVWQIRGGR